MDHLGQHLLAEFYKCTNETLDDENLISDIMTKAVEISKATIIRPFFHKFSPQGVSGIIVIAESHLAIHTWPEHNYAAVDLFSCGDFDFTGALKYIKDKLNAGDYSIISIKRGANLNSSATAPAETFESKQIFL